MTFFGWDASNHDWGRGPMDLARAKREGIEMFTHKAGEGAPGWFDDSYYKRAMDRARAASISVLGGYYVNHPGDQNSQADHFVDLVNSQTPWWKDHPCWVWQVDAEKFEYMPRPPTVPEINAFADRIVARTKCSPKAILVYAPNWLYGGGLGGLKYRNLWSSTYVDGGNRNFKSVYPGDKGTGWNSYSGITPVIWQYTSTAAIAGQGPADANAIRVASLAQMKALFGGSSSSPEPEGEEEEMWIVISNSRTVAAVLIGMGISPSVIPGSRAGALQRLGVPLVKKPDADYMVFRNWADATDAAEYAANYGKQILAKLSTLASSTPDQIADAIMSKLPSGGDVNEATVKSALEEFFAEHFQPEPKSTVDIDAEEGIDPNTVEGD